MAQVQEKVINGLYDLNRVKQYLQQAVVATNITAAIAGINTAITALQAQSDLED